MRKERFYEKDPIVKQAVDSVFLFPPDIQRVLSLGFSTIAEQDFKAHDLMANARSLGTEKVLALYKSKRKLREYDKDPNLHQAMNYLMIMSPESRRLLSHKILELVGFMQNYLVICKAAEALPEQETVEGIANTYVRSGPEEAREMLKTIEKEFKRLLTEGEKPSMRARQQLEVKPSAAMAQTEKPDGARSEAIASESSGMRIRADLA